MRLTSTGPGLTLDLDGNFHAEGSGTDAVFQIAVRAWRMIAGFRVDVFPSIRAKGQDTPRLSARADGDFILTEFRVETAGAHTTNIACGKPRKLPRPSYRRGTAVRPCRPRSRGKS